MPKEYSEPDGLIPAEAKARYRKRGRFLNPKGPGSTVDQEGLLNNYAVETETTIEKEKSVKEKAWLALSFAAVTWIPISIALIVTHW